MTLPSDVLEASRSEVAKYERFEETAWGYVVSDSRFPKVWDANFAEVERDVPLSEVESVVREELERVGGDTAVIGLPDPAATPTIEREMLDRGWEADRDVVMVLRGAPNALPDRARQVRVEERPQAEPELHRAQFEFRRLGPNDREYPDDVMEQLVEHDAMLAEQGARWFAGFVDGELAGYCAVSIAPNGLIYVDNVVTGEPFRRRGVARAVVTGAIEAARASGGTDSYLEAVEDGTPVRLYEGIGFRIVGPSVAYLQRL